MARRHATGHHPEAEVSPCDGEEHAGCDGCAQCDGGWLVLFCCGTHALEAGGVGGAQIEAAPDVGAYARPIGPTFREIKRELEASGFRVREG